MLADMHRIAIAVVTVGTLVACKGKEENKAPAGSPSSSAPGGTASAPVAPPPPSASSVDVCAFASKEQVEGVVGKLSAEPKADTPQGSLLGGCQYSFEGGLAMVHARPASEWQGTVDASGGGTAIADLGEKAVDVGKTGVFVQPAGKPYFLHVLAVTGAGPDNAKATAVAKVVAAGAK